MNRLDVPRRLAILLLALACTRAVAGQHHPPNRVTEPGGHTRPRALAVDARGDLLYAALSTADRLAVIDLTDGRAKFLMNLPMCAFPDALESLPGGGVVVACRFDAGLRVVTRVEGTSMRDRFRVRIVEAGPEHGHRGLAIDGAGRFAYVTSPARGGVKIVDLRAPDRPVRFVATGLFPKTIRFISADSQRRNDGQLIRPLVLVANLIGHTVTIHQVAADGGLSSALQTIVTQAPVLDMAIVSPGASGDDLRGQLLLLTHEDRALSRLNLSVEGLDSVVLAFRPSAVGTMAPFVDPGPGKRTTFNLTERPRDPLVGLDALAVDPRTGRLGIVGAGTDNLLVVKPRAEALLAEPTSTVGANPSSVVFLPDGRVATADRLSDTISIVSAHQTQTLTVGISRRRTDAERGELLFYSRRLVPNNVAAGALSIYTCAACHADGHIDGRRHPSKRNRFFSMTKTCRGLRGTEPFLSLGKPNTFADFADNIVATHAQGALEAPHTYDHYPVRLRLRGDDSWTEVTLSAEGVRAALAAHLADIPVEPSPFVAPGQKVLSTQERQGLEIFQNNCSDCHQLVMSTTSPRAIASSEIEARLLAGQVALTSARLYDVGTPVLGDGGNNPPSLRGVWAAAPFFSDGSASTLEEVLGRTNPAAEKIHAAENAKRAPGFSAAEQADLLAFLRAL